MAPVESLVPHADMLPDAITALLLLDVRRFENHQEEPFSDGMMAVAFKLINDMPLLLDLSSSLGYTSLDFS
jgi:hypothetical protein